MIYLSSFALSDKKVKNPNLYPYSVFQDKDCDPFVFAPITILYGDNGCGKSTLLNIIAQKINAKGYETYAYGQYYIQNYVEECRFDTGEDDTGRNLSIPAGSLYMKSEDVLYEIKKIQQEEALEQGYVYEQVRRKGLRKDVAQEIMLGTLQAKIYNLESTEVEEAKWYELKNVRYFYEFFDKNRKYFVR